MSHLSRRRAAALTTGLALAALVTPATAVPASAATSVACSGGGFTVTLPGGRAVTSDTRVAAKDLPATSRLTVRGRYVTFSVDPSTLATYDYALTGAANAADITGGRGAAVFASKVPDLGTGTLTGDLEVKADRGNLQLLRRGSGVKMKISAKDCAQGGIFQMEPEAAGPVRFTHTLAEGAYYYVNPHTGKVNIGNGTDFRGKDSPQVATKLSQSDTVTTWSVTPGGRLGGVLGEDAVEIGAGPSDCVQDCQAQNRIRGSLPVTDPAFQS